MGCKELARSVYVLEINREGGWRDGGEWKGEKRFLRNKLFRPGKVGKDVVAAGRELPRPKWVGAYSELLPTLGLHLRASIV